jgi:flagellar hook-associated protein 3 FlgL
MIRSLGSYNEQFLLDLERVQARAARAQAQISSGFKVNNLSDAPQLIAGIARSQLDIAKAEQAAINLQRVQAEVNNNEAALGVSVKILQDVIVAGAQGADDQATPAARDLLASRVKEWHSELVRIANSNYGGRYQFAGDQDQSAPYQLDWTQPGGVVRLNNAPDTRLIEDAGGNRFSVSSRAQDIFDARDASDAVAPGNVFDSLHDLSIALTAGDSTQISSALQKVREAHDHVIGKQADFGAAQNRVQEALEDANKKKLRATVELAAQREADVPAAILELSQSAANLEAALGAQARLPRTTLFDYLG